MTNFADFNSATESVVNGWREMKVTGEKPALPLLLFFSVRLFISALLVGLLYLRYAGNYGTFSSTFTYDTFICHIRVKHTRSAYFFRLKVIKNVFLNNGMKVYCKKHCVRSKSS